MYNKKPINNRNVQIDKRNVHLERFKHFLNRNVEVTFFNDTETIKGKLMCLCFVSYALIVETQKESYFITKYKKIVRTDLNE